jgi:hypothetical protein
MDGASGVVGGVESFDLAVLECSEQEASGRFVLGVRGVIEVELKP